MEVQQESSSKINVLLITEGTYPYYGGGVSTWCDDLVQNISSCNFSVVCITDTYKPNPNLTFPKNVQNIYQFPLWDAEEPIEYIGSEATYEAVVRRKNRTNSIVIETLFLPHFEKFMRMQFADEYSIEELNRCLKKMWEYFSRFDYKSTLKHELIWNSLKNIISESFDEQILDNTSLEDITAAGRLLYRFLQPITVDLPKTDISHLTIAGFAGLIAINQKFKYKTPIFLTEHGVFMRERLLAIGSSNYSIFLKLFLTKISEAISRLVYHNADQISTVTHFNKSWETKYGADLNKIKVLYNGVDTQKFKPSKAKQSKKFKVVAAARIFELKDILTMIKVCHQVKRTFSQIEFIVYGNKDAVPEYTKACETLIRDLQLESNFKLAGFHSEPHKIYLEGDLSILTSISEGFPYTVIESMSCGIPVVATDVGGVIEAIDESTGIICKPKDVEALAKAVVKLLTEDSLRVEMGERSREKVVKHFSIETFTSHFEHSYFKLTKVNTKSISRKTVKRLVS